MTPQTHTDWRLHLASFRKTTLIDFPGRLAALVYTAGCPFRCPFCHNPSLVTPTEFTPRVEPQEVLDFLATRRGKLDGLAITGGEPTLWADLPRFISSVKSLGFQVKLDTNGVSPHVLRNLIAEGLLDYVAMDVKAGLDRYPEIVAHPVNTEKIAESITILKEGHIEYEFRTTVPPELYSQEDYRAITELIDGAERFALQGFRPGNCLDKSWNDCPPTKRSDLEALVPLFAPHAKNIEVRL